MNSSKKLFWSLLLSLLVILGYFIKKENGIQYLYRIYSDYRFFNDLSLIESSINDTIVIPLSLDKLSNEQILNYLVENESGLFSQRLIMGLNNYYSINYIFWRLFNKELDISMEDKGVFMLEELTKKLEYGVGGIHLTGNIIASFQDVEGLNSFIAKLKEICKVERYIKFLDSEIILTI